MKAILHKYQNTLLIISRSILNRLRNVSEKNFIQNQNTYFMLHKFFPEKSAIYEIMWRNTVKPDTPQVTSGHLATDTHSDYVTLIVFPLQQWLHERASTLRYTYIACLV